MSEDETFIRAIVDAPGDDLPRLVYADWLDDRDDPRSAYLRAELEVVNSLRSRDEFVLPIDDRDKLAAGLDPVWVARVSRPPVGACCDKIRFENQGPQLSPADIAACEHRLRASLPAWYHAFLLNYNGGTIAREYCYQFYSFRPDASRAVSPSLLMMWEEFRSKARELPLPESENDSYWWQDCLPIHGYSYPDGLIRFGELEGVLFVSGSHAGSFAELSWCDWPHALNLSDRLPAVLCI